MIHAKRNPWRPAAALLATAMLASACSILPENDPVLLLDPRLPVSAVAGENLGWTLNVALPEADPARDSTRMLVRTEEGRLQVHPSARWVASAPALFRTLLVRYLRDGGMLDEVGAGAGGMDRTLALDLRHFELSETGPEQLEARIRVEARLYDSPGSRLLARRMFEVRQPTRSAQANDALAGFEAALGEIIPALAGWVTGHAAPGEDAAGE